MDNNKKMKVKNKTSVYHGSMINTATITTSICTYMWRSEQLISVSIIIIIIIVTDDDDDDNQVTVHIFYNALTHKAG